MDQRETTSDTEWVNANTLMAQCTTANGTWVRGAAQAPKPAPMEPFTKENGSMTKNTARENSSYRTSE